MTRARRRGALTARTALGAGLLAGSLVLGLAACSQSPEAVDASLHASVVRVAERAQSGDHLGAIAALALLDNEVTAGVESGAIGEDQAADIRAAIALVQADLEAAEVASTPAPTPTDDDDDDNDNRGPGNNNGNDKKRDKGDDD
ncbi:hypothetical protein ACWGST_10355 [Agromyces sp. NPDC055520]